MSNIWFYEPFYDFDRLFDEAFTNRQAGQGTQVPRLTGPGPDASKVSRVLKPRYVYQLNIFQDHFFQITLFV